MSVQRIGVIGAGTMGNGIAQICAVAGLQVTMIDVSDAAVERGMKALAGSLDRPVKKEKLEPAQKDAALALVQGATDYAALKGADLVIEAATENLELKLRILRQIDALVPESTVIATNTSSISITQLAAVVTHPQRFIGAHFFNPVPMMALLELIRGLQTSDDTHAKAIEFASFVVNRILVPMINEAIFVLQEGLATAEDVDTGMPAHWWRSLHRKTSHPGSASSCPTRSTARGEAFAPHARPARCAPTTTTTPCRPGCHCTSRRPRSVPTARRPSGCCCGPS
jgi:3-hydroxybutyryl-CoA dehydrogenase